MVARINSSAPVGINGIPIVIECDLNNGLPSITVVGLGTKAIDEAKERVKSALLNSGLLLPRKRITINLSPADLPKDGSSYDLPIAVSILVSSQQIADKQSTSSFVGELALDGKIQPVPGIINHVQCAKDRGLPTIYVPKDNAQQASLIRGIGIIPVNSLKHLYRILTDQEPAPKLPAANIDSTHKETDLDIDDIVGQELAKRALEIAASGHHNMLMTGPPGTGKTMLAKALLGVLPPLSREETIEVTNLHSIGSSMSNSVILNRPFRSPHHTSSQIALIGGGVNANPGEISLAHCGVLFLDELPEYGRSVIEALRQPLEDKKIDISRANRRARYPADFMLIATQNPCPCGFYGDEKRQCICTAYQILQYQKRISGPLLDRIDLVVNVDRISASKLLRPTKEKSSPAIRSRVQSTRKYQLQRNKGRTNSQLSTRELKKLALSNESKEMLEQALDRMNISPRAVMRTLRVARTIADMERAEKVSSAHIAEALQYRIREEVLV